MDINDQVIHLIFLTFLERLLLCIVVALPGLPWRRISVSRKALGGHPCRALLEIESADINDDIKHFGNIQPPHNSPFRAPMA